uniref:Uncharacterized protein n=1 Tax=Panagrolaimus davidi TaxID=227884 RepID=A0A914QRF4_9BILA
MFIIFLVSITVLFISAANTGSPSVNWKNETFYVVDPDCYFISAASISAIQEGINNYSPASSNRLCENVSSTVYRNPKGNHIIFVRYESLKEISIAIQQTNGSTNFNLKDLFVKVNYEYILGDYCNFDKTLLSIGVDSNMSYITVKCGNDEWAFMRSVLTSTGEFYTPFGPLIYFQKGDPSFNRLSFLSLYDENDNIFHDSVVLRYTIKKVTCFTCI